MSKKDVGEYSYHAIIHKAYMDISGLCHVWGTKSEKIAVAEHPAEGKTSRIHCHILILGSHVQKNRLRTIAKSLIDLADDDRILESYKDYLKRPQKCNVKGLIYLFKGESNRIKYFKGFEQSEIDNSLNEWKDYSKSDKGNSEQGDSENNKPKTDWQIIQDMLSDLEKEPAVQKLVETPDGGLTYESSYSRQSYNNIINKHLNLNHKKTSIHDAQRWLGTLLRNSPGDKEVFWDMVWTRFSKL